MQFMGKWLGLAAALTMGTMALAQDGKSKPWWGVDVGFYHPTSNEISDRFGDTLFRLGIRPFEDRITKDWKFAVDFTVLTARKRGDRLLAIPLTFGFTRSFGNPEGSAIPFVQFGVGPAFYDYSITRDAPVETNGTTTERVKDSRWGGNANIEVGVMFNRRFSVSVRGDWYTKTDDFDFSGVSLSLSYAAFKW
jgi:hypothetical protein